MPLPAAAGFLAFFLGTSLASIVFRVFSLIGIGIIGYVGADTFFDSAVQLLRDQFEGLPETFTNTLGYIELDTGLSMILSAYSIKITLITARRFLGVRQ